ncbi:SDR family oxidoreductase [Rhodococcus sp. BP-349]|uniref:SDR family oxidoreductase n=1 Tax=unclassified Rhodococcus (in: high G+C Gram-positive bacteria) TaxID=192944 RepID=UPI001C9B8CCD|nr:MULTISPECIES: SDR family oxidoreductase [unclassified Rhodococcus (in: high G+C Gram-positive bacteria)]MBY6539000.1 SDR family oxidoreductase [Rhodococcus sp. BP-363]MBY6543337.1 SDR family oxidoreductase [Rhodococcus sp. BP-369]MBY6562567.1 SDR family oxidoreductase [Rhodococcus sp. BP-370]MBY6576859.1 SDR family oxidoreductase [Rhodococcus sp. BP-364]MBY6586160.1 SDR family oxidoreductase [Rhodococcus sp. BP-358]
MNTQAGARVVVTGATGYIGGRLAPRLQEAGYRVRVLARSPQKLRDVPWAADVEVVQGDLSDRESLDDAFRDVDVVYYLVHSMGGSDHFAEAERQSAENVADAAKAAGVQRIVYLGGLHPVDGALSPHLESRAEVGRILIESGVFTVVLQAGVVIGSGSASFEMIRHLTNRLPVMTTPKWVHNQIQPIAVRDVLHYLIESATAPFETSRTWDIGGPDVLQYGEMMNEYASVAGLRKRRMLVLPVLTPRLAGHWIGLVTPIPRGLAMPLIESLQYDAIAHERDIDTVVPPPEGGLTTFADSVHLALRRIEDGEVETTWSNATDAGAPSDPLPSDPDWAGEVVYVDERAQDCNAPPELLWDVVEGIGGENGWYSFPAAWVIRGWMDKIVGGVGLKRGRRDPRRLVNGEALDWWRVEEIERGSLLRLRAEMKAPGGAWLELRVLPRDGGTRSRYEQRAIFFPRGLGGRLYWFAIMPFHGVIFRGMLENITGKAERAADTGDKRDETRVG